MIVGYGGTPPSGDPPLLHISETILSTLVLND